MWSSSLSSLCFREQHFTCSTKCYLNCKRRSALYKCIVTYFLDRYVFLGIYTCEMMIKVVSKGLVLDRLTYLRSPWNWLDFVVILSGYATLAVEIGNLAGLRTFRVLRALKTVSIIPGEEAFTSLLWGGVMNGVGVNHTLFLVLGCS